MIKCTQLISNKTCLAVLSACIPAFFVACSFQQYSAKPIDPVANAAKFDLKDPASKQFNLYLINNNYSADRLPIQEWDVDALIYCALFFHPSLDVARAQWRVAELAQENATGKPLPTINSHLAHSNQANGDVSPFAFGLSIDIPIDTAKKRDIRIENASHLAQAAKLEIAQTAWQLRNQLVQSLNEYQFNQQQIRLLLDETSRRQEIVNIYQKRVNLGAASNVELSTAKLQLQTNTSELIAVQQSKMVLLAKLASNLGLPLAKVASMPLLGATDTLRTKNLQVLDLQATALLNRLDIRIALEKYAAAEAKLKLEIAKQYPDIVISPGYAYEFGDKIWSLGLSGLMTLLNKNKIGIAEATQLREVEAAQFEALQSKVIAEANITYAELTQAKQSLMNQQQLHHQQQLNSARMERQFAAGEISRLELAFVKLENIAAEKNVVLADYQLKTAINQLENSLQKPLSLVVDEKVSDGKVADETSYGVKNEP